MRTVLVCVRTPLAAQNLAAVAARLGMTNAVRTAASDPEVMLRLTERPADVVLVDMALTRPDTVGFVRRVLTRSPQAAVLLFGAEDRGIAAAVVAAGARGLIHGGDHDLVGAVARTLLLLAVPVRGAARPRLRNEATVARSPMAAPVPAEIPGAVRFRGQKPAADPSGGPEAGALPPADTHRAGAAAEAQATGSPPGTSRPEPAGPGGGGNPLLVPVQRVEDLTGEDRDEESAGEQRTPADTTRRPGPGTDLASPAGDGGRSRGTGGSGTGGKGRQEPPVEARLVRADQVIPTAAVGPGAGCRIVLTERELQVLLGMADGKSNAEIGRELYVSEDTVKTHARRLFRKLGARDRAHAVAAGFRAGLVA